MKSLTNLMIAVFFSLFSTTSYACVTYSQTSYQFGQYIKEYIGTNNQNNCYGASRTVYYGLGGNDTFRSRGGAEYQIFAGGNGDDAYHTEANSFMTIADTSPSRNDVLYAPHFRFWGNRSYVATYHRGRHLIAGDTVTGSVIVWIDYKNRLNAIENVVMPDMNIRYNFIRTKLHRLGNYLGDLSQRSLYNIGVAMPHPRTVINGLRYYKSRAIRIQRANRFNHRFNQGYQFKQSFNENDYTSMSFSNDKNFLSYELGDIYHTNLDQDMELYRLSSFDQNAQDMSDFNNAQLTSYAYKLSDDIEINLSNYLKTRSREMALAQTSDIHIHTYGVKVNYKLSENLILTLGHKFNKDNQGLLGKTDYFRFGFTDAISSTSESTQLGFGYRENNWRFAASMLHGSAEVDLARNPFLRIDDNMSMKSYGFEVERSQLFNSQDKLTFSYSVPPYIDSANLVNATGSLFGESDHTENIHNINKYEVYSLNYDHELSDNALVMFSAMKRKFDNARDQDYYFINYNIEF
jgi:hypothetical protein